MFWEKKKNEGRMYDLRNLSLDHFIVFEGEHKYILNTQRVHGFLTPYVSAGDTFLFPTNKGLAVWQFVKVENCDDPRDMFFGVVGVIRYATDEDLKIKLNLNKDKYETNKA